MNKKGIAFMVMMVLFYSAFIAVHESTHYVINGAHGLESEFSICDYSPCVIVNQTQLNDMYTNDRGYYYVWRQSQNNVEAFGYQIGIFYIFVIMFLYVIAERVGKNEV